MELRDRWAIAIFKCLSKRYGEQGYDDRGAILESYRLASHAVGIKDAVTSPSKKE